MFQINLFFYNNTVIIMLAGFMLFLFGSAAYRIAFYFHYNNNIFLHAEAVLPAGVVTLVFRIGKLFP